MTRVRVVPFTTEALFSTLETVAVDTLARLATSSRFMSSLHLSRAITENKPSETNRIAGSKRLQQASESPDHRFEGKTGFPKTVNSTTPRGFACRGQPVTVRRT